MSLKTWWNRVTGKADGGPLLDAEELMLWYRGLDKHEQAAFTAQVAPQVRAPRKAKDPNKLTSRVTGRLLFEVDGPDGPIPMHHMKLELWDRDIGSPDDFLGEGFTDADGRFEIRYDPKDAGPFDIPDLDLRIFEPHHVFAPDGGVHDRWKRIWAELGPDDFSGEHYDFGELRVPYWEYDPHWPIPRLLITEEGEAPTSYAPGRSLAMVKAVAPVELTKRKHLLQMLDGVPPSLDAIEADYPTCITREMEKANPGSSRSDEWFGARLMNGMFASVLDRDPDNADGFRLYHHWNSYEQDGVHILPNVDMRFVLKDGLLHPVKITLGLREPGATAPNSPVTREEITPDQPERWAAAKRIARISATLDTELGSHLSQCHLNMEQYAIAAQRNLRGNPVRYLLAPHLREVVLINSSANNFLIGPEGYITRAGALTADSINERIVQIMGTYDWKDYAPAAPVSEQHSYGRASNLFWTLCTEHVDRFFEQHLDAIQANWLEVRRFSDEAVAHSAPFFVCGHVRGEVIERGATWYLKSERANLDIERPLVDGIPRAVSRITDSDAATEEGLENLKQLCRYVIFMATFRHTWANNRQWEDGGEVRYTSLGLRWSEAGPFAPEDDLDTLPSARHATEMLWISYMLSKTNYGFLLDNTENDVDPRFVDDLRARVDDFGELELDLKRVNSRINI